MTITFPYLRAIIMAMMMVFTVSTHAHANFSKGYIAYLAGDYETVLEEFKKSANEGDTEAQNNLGVMYSNGQGVL